MKERVRARLEIQRLGDARSPLRVELGPKTSPNKPPSSRAATARAGKERSAHRSRTCPPPSNGCWRKSSNRFTTRLGFPQEQHTRCKDLRRPEEAVEDGFAFSFWCGSAIAKPKSRKKPRHMRCIPLEQREEAGLVFTAASPPPRGRSSLGPIRPFLSGNMSRANFSTLLRAGASFSKSRNYV